MFIRSNRGYTRHGEQWASGPFLMLIVDKDSEEPNVRRNVRAIVRSVRLKQLGHFMMGAVSIKTAPNVQHHISVSGAYGSDGLLLDVPSDVFALGVPLPLKLYDAWSHGGGHNNVGSEAHAIHDWALKNMKALTRTYKQVRKDEVQ